MLTDIAAIPECRTLLAAFLVVHFLASLVPAVALSYSAQLLAIVQVAVDTRTVDRHRLLSSVAGSVLAALATRLLRLAKQRISAPLHRRIKLHYSVHIFRALARLDVPTFDDPAVQRQLDHAFPSQANPNNIAFAAVQAALQVASTALQLVSQFSVLVAVLRDQPDGPLLAALCFLLAYFQWNKSHKPFISNGAWKATTTDKDYIKSEGLKRTVNNPAHRKEIVAAGLAPVLLAQYRHAVARIADRAGDFYEAVAADARNRDALSLALLLHELLRALPELVFALRALHHPASIPLSLASLHLITQTAQSFTYAAFALVDEGASIAERLAAVRLLYDVAHIPNQVRVKASEKRSNDDDADDDDDTRAGVPFPEDARALHAGVSVEFRGVSFRYPGATAWALRDVSFRVPAGQLCVILGANGSGKSTVLKLLARLYDPAAGTILLDGADVRTLRLADVRAALAVLFQDYTLFPLSIRDNIALGDPAADADPDLDTRVEAAARLAGADACIEGLPQGYDTYLERPVRDYASAPQEAGGEGEEEGEGEGDIDGGGEGGEGGKRAEKRNRGLSGGQMQRIALARTFMRAVVSERDRSVGLLLFDEPSASLDPTAEHDLFERLRMLRGSKTMLFSSHRFGNLTRHADRILYMKNAQIVEEGTHDELLRHDGEYARIWKLQAAAFL